MIKTLLVDDEFPARAELKCLLEELGGFSIVGEFEDGEEALKMIKEKDIDLVFLDIQMSGKDGLTTAWEIIQLPKQPRIVFSTGYNEYAVKAFDLNAVDYIMKPYSIKRLEQTKKKLDNFLKRKAQQKFQVGNRQISVMFDKDTNIQKGKLAVWANDRLILLKHSEICFIKTESKGGLIFNTEKGVFQVRNTMKEIEKKLDSASFIRTHKSYLINREKITEIVPWFNNTYLLVLEGCTEKDIPVSRHYIKEFNRMMGI